MNLPVLITGGAGSLGRRTAKKFIAGGWPVRAFDLPFMDFAELENQEGVQIQKGDITDTDAVEEAIAGTAAVIHLAALLPPVSEKDKERTFSVNVEGTRNIVNALSSSESKSVLVFTSSISTYGDTSHQNPPIMTSHPQTGIDIYAESKIAGEHLVVNSNIRFLILRVASIAVPAFLEPPDPWPFLPGQRVEMVHRDDVVDALYAAASTPAAVGQILNIGGGSTWQLTGKDYVEDFFNFMGAPMELASYRNTPGWNDWYYTEDSQELLGFQNRSYQKYSDEMRAIVEAMMN